MLEAAQAGSAGAANVAVCAYLQDLQRDQLTPRCKLRGPFS